MSVEILEIRDRFGCVFVVGDIRILMSVEDIYLGVFLMLGI